MTLSPVLASWNAYDDSLSNAVRHNRTPQVFTANEAPQNVEIFLHHEMAQTVFPSHCFSSVSRLLQGVALRRCAALMCYLKNCQHLPEFVGLAERRARAIPPCPPRPTPPRGRAEVGARPECRRRGGRGQARSLERDWQWLPDDAIRTTTALSLIRHAPSGNEVFFNQLIAAFCGWQDQRNRAPAR